MLAPSDSIFVLVPTAVFTGHALYMAIAGLIFVAFQFLTRTIQTRGKTIGCRRYRPARAPLRISWTLQNY
jgi:hypothetical protein